MYSEQISIESSSNKEQQQVFQVLQPCHFNEKQNQVTQSPTISIKLNDYYVVLQQKEINQQFQTQEDWMSFLNKKFAQRQTSMSFVSLNSILNVKYTQIQRRVMIWETITKQLSLNKTEDSAWEETDAKTIKQINQNIDKMFKRLSVQKQKEFQDEQLKFMLCHLICQFQHKQNHTLGTLKGLEYICYGIFIASPIKDFPFMRKCFLYFMNVLQLKQIYSHGSPLFYSEINLICSQLKHQTPKLFNRLQSSNADQSKIFIAHYRTLLMNRLVRKQVISKIIQLILIYGISAVRMILVRIISLQQDKLLNIQDPQDLMEALATTLVFQQLHSQTGYNTASPGIKLEQAQQSTGLEMKQQGEKMKQKQSEEVVKMFRKLIIGI